ncbi:MAG TPA: hypothetical protein VGQ44_13510 [Gemmatimonadaceae bacterium]|nr:hypothetical protein [Gemmatimonadaceae bacterium]
MRPFELLPDPQVSRERAYVVDLDSIVLMSEVPGAREWHVEFSSGSYLNLTEDEYDQMLAAWTQGERVDGSFA